MQYEDDEGDKVLLATDGDLIGAINHARTTGLKVVFSLSGYGALSHSMLLEI